MEKNDIWSNYQRKEKLGNAKTIEELCTSEGPKQNHFGEAENGI